MEEKKGSPGPSKKESFDIVSGRNSGPSPSEGADSGQLIRNEAPDIFKPGKFANLAPYLVDLHEVDLSADCLFCRKPRDWSSDMVLNIRSQGKAIRFGVCHECRKKKRVVDMNIAISDRVFKPADGEGRETKGMSHSIDGCATSEPEPANGTLVHTFSENALTDPNIPDVKITLNPGPGGEMTATVDLPALPAGHNHDWAVARVCKNPACGLVDMYGNPERSGMPAPKPKEEGIVYCEACKCEISKKRWEKHKISKVHIEKIKERGWSA